jgi:hypothetical protein
MNADVDHVIEAAKVLEKHPESAVTVASVKKKVGNEKRNEYKSSKRSRKCRLSYLQIICYLKRSK